MEVCRGIDRCTLRASMWSMNMQCERLLAMFMGVSQMVRFVSPRNSCAAVEPMSSWAHFTACVP